MPHISSSAKNFVYKALIWARYWLLFRYLPAPQPSDDESLNVYHGNLFPDEAQFNYCYGLGVKRLFLKDLTLNDDGLFPLRDNSVLVFQSQDVLEHIPYDNAIQCLNEIFRVLKPGGLFRLSVPDYRSPVLTTRCVFDSKQRIVGDLLIGDIPYINCNGDLAVRSTARPTNRHMWFPDIDSVLSLIKLSLFSQSEIEILHCMHRDGSFTLRDIPFSSKFPVKRSPPNDNRAQSMPISIVIDLYKN